MGSFLIVGSSAEARLQHTRELTQIHSTGPDLIIFEAPTSIAQAREVKASLTRRPYQSDRISVILTEAHLLTPEAQTALLKTLEEPPGSTDIYLLAQDPQLLLPTVRSRTQTIDLGPANSSVTTEQLAQAWTAYRSRSLVKLWGLDLTPTIWAELGRQLLLVKLNPQLLTTPPQLTDIASEAELVKIASNLEEESLEQFLREAQVVNNDLKLHVNHKLALENLTLTLHQIR